MEVIFIFIHTSFFCVNISHRHNHSHSLHYPHASTIANNTHCRILTPDFSCSLYAAFTFQEACAPIGRFYFHLIATLLVIISFMPTSQRHFWQSSRLKESLWKIIFRALNFHRKMCTYHFLHIKPAELFLFITTAEASPRQRQQPSDSRDYAIFVILISARFSTWFRPSCCFRFESRIFRTFILPRFQLISNSFVAIAYLYLPASTIY